MERSFQETDVAMACHVAKEKSEVADMCCDLHASTSGWSGC